MQSVHCGFRGKGLLVKLWLHSHEALTAELKCCTEIARSKKVPLFPSGFEAPRRWAGKRPLLISTKLELNKLTGGQLKTRGHYSLLLIHLIEEEFLRCRRNPPQVKAALIKNLHPIVFSFPLRLNASQSPQSYHPYNWESLFSKRIKNKVY